MTSSKAQGRCKKLSGEAADTQPIRLDHLGITKQSNASYMCELQLICVRRLATELSCWLSVFVAFGDTLYKHYD